MYKFLQNYGKQLMAIFSAFLMIAFMLPAAAKYSGSGKNAVVGKVNGQKIHAVDTYNAEQAWKMLKDIRINQQGATLASILGPDAVQQIDRRPVLFLLLQKEAQDMGMTVSDDQLNSLMTNVPQLAQFNSTQRAEAVKSALFQLMLVRAGFQRATSAIKVSDPMVEHQLAELGQTLSLNAVEFTTAQYLPKVSEPTAEQLKAQFEKYAQNLKGDTSTSNPFGFGYKYPNRIKLQYIALPRADVRKFVENFSAPGKAKDPYQWEVEAQKYYLQNPRLYPTTRPAKPANGAFSLEGPAATTRPFAEVRDEIKKKLIDEATDRKLAQVQERINSALQQDWAAWHNAANGATRPATAPATALGVPYDSVDYLKKLAEQIQAQTGVLPTVQSIADKWLTQEDLAKLPGIGSATLEGFNRMLTAPQYLILFCADFVSEANRTDSNVLQELQPTRPLADSSDTVYIARISAAQAAHKPPTLAEVADDVKADVKRQAAYELAKADAARLLDAARSSGDLKSAAKNVVTVGPLSNRPGTAINGLAITGPAGDLFIDEAFKMLSAGGSTDGAATTAPTTQASASTRPGGNARPITMIELPRDGRVVVAQVADVQAMWTERSRPLEEAQLSSMITTDYAARFARDWYNFDSVKARLKYEPEKTSADKEQSAPPEPPAPPIF